MRFPSWLAFGGVFATSIGTSLCTSFCVAGFCIVGFWLVGTPALAQVRSGGGVGMSAPFAAHPSAAPVAISASHRAPVAGGALRTGVVSRVGVAPRAGTAVSQMRVVNGVIHITRRRMRPIAATPAFSPRHDDFVEDTSGFDFDDVPGLGFDFPHLAATHPNGFRHRRDRARIGSFVPFFDGGFFFPSSPVVVDEEGDGQQSDVRTDVRNEEVAPARNSRRVRAPSEQPTETSASAVAVEVPLDNTQYVFVRRDGSVFFAVAYFWESGQLHYITNLGTRGTLEREALDLDATRRFNEDRGLAFSFPA